MKRVREQAAELCSIAASVLANQGLCVDEYGTDEAANLAWRALHEASRRMPQCYGRALWGEAECLLRTGAWP